MVWSENGTTPPQPGEEKDKAWFSPHKPVFYDQYSTTSLNNRYVPPTHPPTHPPTYSDVRTSLSSHPPTHP